MTNIKELLAQPLKFLNNSPSLQFVGANANIRPTKEEYYLNIAIAVAQRSTCLRSNYGSVIVLKDRIISTGYNGSRRGGINCCDRGRCLRPEGKTRGDYEKCPAVHSEISSLVNATTDVSGASIFIAGVSKITGEEKLGDKCLPCKNCFRALCNAQIKEVWIRNSDRQPYCFPIEQLAFVENED